MSRCRLSSKEEIRLLLAAQSGSLEARDELILVHNGLLKAIAYRFNKTAYHSSELYADAVLGMIQVISRFDLSLLQRFQNTCFASLSYLRIAQQVTRSSLVTDTGLNVRRSERIRKLHKARMQLYAETGEISHVQLQEMTGFTLFEIESLDLAYEVANPVSLDATLTYEDCDTYHDKVADDNSLPSFEGIDIQYDLDYFLSHLCDKERFVVTAYFGIPEHLTRQQLSEKLGCCPTTITEIYKGAMCRLQAVAQETTSANSLLCQAI